MEATSRQFEAKAREALAKPSLQAALDKMGSGFGAARRAAIDDLPEFEALRDTGRDIKNHVLENLDFYLERFEAKVIEQGGQVHWCRDAEEARQTVLGICRELGARTVTKGKTMIAEEIGLNEFLEEQSVEPIETDLGEYIIQLRHEPPSHIIAPAVHVTVEEVADVFRETHAGYDPARVLEEPTVMLNEAREVLRDKFLAADVGITGANFLVAETGSSVIVTNEGNGDLTQLLPKAHVVLASLEKVIPTLEDMTTLLRLLARSATGQEMSVYTTVSTGPRRAGDLDGPAAYHVVLLDNGRSKLLGGEFQDVLRCIRCGACMNDCPVYRQIGGHAYGWVYPGPVGSVLTPHLIGIEEAGHLPNASTFCGKCESVCPVRIPLPKMLRHWRERQFERRLQPATARAGLGVWAFFAKRPLLYRWTTGIAMRLLAALGRKSGRFTSLPLAGAWTRHRDLPAPQGKTFQQLWAERRRDAA
jgi:L-lactate dehydrogenase complex protein LldF